jgi:hypothetical protein
MERRRVLARTNAVQENLCDQQGHRNLVVGAAALGSHELSGERFTDIA